MRYGFGGEGTAEWKRNRGLRMPVLAGYQEGFKGSAGSARADGSWMFVAIADDASLMNEVECWICRHFLGTLIV